MMPLPAESGQFGEQVMAEPEPGLAEVGEPLDETDGRCGYGPVCCF
ncbi:MAG TPA: hypothetical protein VFB06_37015 [Streptosporangiaceae bacterium]|nr:hypothetical protein [Streptosporangiaceae bacterium]